MNSYAHERKKRTQKAKTQLQRKLRDMEDDDPIRAQDDRAWRGGADDEDRDTEPAPVDNGAGQGRAALENA